MNRKNLKRVIYLFIILTLGFFVTRCVSSKETLHAHGEMAPIKTFPKDYVHPLSEINLERVVDENRGLRILEENATSVHDYYRGGVQEKEEAERFVREEKWEEAQNHLEKSNKFLRVVLRYLSEDEAYRNIYGDTVMIFLPNLLMAENYLKLINTYKKMGKDYEVVEAERYGNEYLARSLKNVKTEWALQIKKGFEEELLKK